LLYQLQFLLLLLLLQGLFFRSPLQLQYRFAVLSCITFLYLLWKKNSKFKCEFCPVLLRFCHSLCDNVPQIRQFCEVSGRALIRDRRITVFIHNLAMPACLLDLFLVIKTCV
jgi:hypothetical protein